MNKPVAFICACIAGIGLVILARSTFLAVIYGSMEAGNFNRCWYLTKRDPQTGKLMREWDTLAESTEDPLTRRLDMWFVGIAFVVVGTGIYVAERATGTRHARF